ncbi:MAG: prepilin-type N-terminal cleavage/methylation domain-containing protein [Planctomycetia bacterium]|jgi:Tfp pilus assembly protein FimT
MFHKKPNRRGITLIELLVVMTIMMILAAVVLPQLNFGNDRHKAREAARMVSTYLSVARNRAIETGRPCGVLFQRVNGNHNASVQMIQVQEPAPYAGDSVDSRARVTGNTVTIYGTDAAKLDMIRAGDMIQLNHQGPWYSVGADQEDNTTGDPDSDGILDGLKDVDGDGIIDLTITLYPPPGSNYKIPDYSIGTRLPFQIRRQPVAFGSNQTIRSMTPPLRLPRGTAVDLSASGSGTKYFFNYGGTPVTIMFNPNGSVDALYGMGGNTHVIQPIYLLVGEDNQVPNESSGTFLADTASVTWYEDPDIPDNDKRPNWQNPDSRWVMIMPSTGIATVADNGVAVDPVTPTQTWKPDGSPDDGVSPTGTQNDLRIEVQWEAIPQTRKIASEGLDGGDR